MTRRALLGALAGALLARPRPKPQPQAVMPARTNFPAAPLAWWQYRDMVADGRIVPYAPSRDPAPQCACSRTVHACWIGY